ncbi:MAG: hybrid sensor histidine kinase/response regulator [Planctomycetaceae bacterium]
MSTDAKAIHAERFAEIGNLIQRDAGVIIERWRQRAMQDQPQARRVHLQILLNDLPDFLAELGRGLTVSGDPYSTPHCRPAASHGQQRWEAGWSLEELVRDYQILRLVTLDYLDEALERSMHLREVLAVGLALDEAIAASVARYTIFCDEQSQQQAEALRAADRRKNEFLATLAHELRNPLAPLRNSLEVLGRNATDPKTRQQLWEMMDRQVRQMARLVDDLQDMSRIALGKLVLRSERVDLLDALSQAVQTATPLATIRRQNLTASWPDEPIWVDGDAARLVQIFVNLLNNAVKYTPVAGEVSVMASREGDRAVCRVRDNGVGVPAEMQRRIFELFTQIDLGSDREQTGLGIGLSLVRKLVELHGGSIELHSQGHNQGSEFIVSLPTARAGAERANDDSPAPPSASGRRILIIEDNADGRRSLQMLLQLAGHEVVTAETGNEGIEVATANPPQVALVDIGLPGMDGYEVARRLRTLCGPNTLLIALTGFSQPQDRERALEAGFNWHLVKPVDLDTLEKALATASRLM